MYIFIMEFIQTINTYLQLFIESYGFYGVFIAMFIQAIIPVAIPSDAVIIAAVLLNINPILVIIASALGSTLGGLIGFTITRKGGKPVAMKFIGKKQIERFENWFERWGNYIIVFGRAAPFLSSDAIAYAAGLTKINVKTFVVLALIGGVLRVTLVHHFSFFINSFCHFIGRKNYDIDTSARDSWFMALFTFGEGYHNFHHKFQWDYRNGISWYSFDPSKWIIKFLSYFKITYGLREAPESSIIKAKIETINNKIKELLDNKIIAKSHYRNKIKNITTKAISNLKSLKDLEKKYQIMKAVSLSKRKKIWYKKKINLHKLQLKNSVSSLMLIFLNLKNIS